MTDTAPSAAASSGPWWRSGKVVIVGIAVALVVGWSFYRQTVPPAWLRAFGADIALRANADPEAPLPQDVREATPRGLADNPLICMKSIIPLAWDRVVFLTQAQARANTALLADVDWPRRVEALRQLSADDRYQLVVLLREGEVIDSQLFYTFWADLSALARPDGFTPESAIFTADSRAGHYVLAAASGATLAACPKP